MLIDAVHLVNQLLLQFNLDLFSSLEPKAQGEFIGWDSSGRTSVRPYVRLSTLSNMNISETSRPIVIKFHQKHHRAGRLTALGFGPDRIRTSHGNR